MKNSLFGLYFVGGKDYENCCYDSASALVLILIVLFQSGKSQGLSGAIGGIADSYMSRSKARSVDAKLAKATKWVGAIFVILTLVLNCMVAAGL